MFTSRVHAFRFIDDSRAVLWVAGRETRVAGSARDKIIGAAKWTWGGGGGLVEVKLGVDRQTFFAGSALSRRTCCFSY